MGVNHRMINVCLASVLSLSLLWGCSSGDVVTPTQTGPSANEAGTTTVPFDKEEPMLPVTRPAEGNTDGIAQLRLYNVRGNWTKSFETADGMFFEADSIQTLLDGLRQRGLDAQKLDLTAYDEAFFAENRLVVIPRRTNSGSVRFQANIEVDNGMVHITTIGKMPQVGTTDMADWLVLVPLNRTEYPGKVTVETFRTAPSNAQRYIRHRF